MTHSDSPESLSRPCTAFDGHRLLSSGALVNVALAVKTATDSGATGDILVFDDVTGRVIDLDLRGTKADILERLAKPAPKPVGRYRSPSQHGPDKNDSGEARGRGRPKLGVIAREVTLLPRHWEWLADQPGGASAVLRRLVEEARRNGGAQRQRRTAREAAYQFMLAMAGDRPGYEEATRALFGDNRAGLERCIADWPKDIRTHALRLAFGADDQTIGEWP